MTPFLSCDWGTSSFRLRLIAQGAIVKEFRSAEGVRALYERAREMGGSAENRQTVFTDYLSARLDAWGDVCESGALDLVISGMASSTLGWKELSYAKLPLLMDAGSLHFEQLAWPSPAWIKRTFLLSGVATATEIMRGEETEAIGLLAGEPPRERSILVLPGTHSKHLLVEGDRITDFWTYMTGELFEVMAQHSVLRATVETRGMQEGFLEHAEAFDEGVELASRKGLGRAVFRTRTRAVLDSRPGAENAWFLSGVLIAAELTDLRERSVPILLGGAAELRSLYARALARLSLPRWIELPASRIEKGVPAGHALFLAKRTQ